MPVTTNFPPMDVSLCILVEACNTKNGTWLTLSGAFGRNQNKQKQMDISPAHFLCNLKSQLPQWSNHLFLVIGVSRWFQWMRLAFN